MSFPKSSSGGYSLQAGAGNFTGATTSTPIVFSPAYSTTPQVAVFLLGYAFDTADNASVAVDGLGVGYHVQVSAAAVTVSGFTAQVDTQTVNAGGGGLSVTKRVSYSWAALGKL